MSNLHALLIGIDDYFPDRLPDGHHYPHLQGPTRDVSRMGLLLRDHAGLQPERTRLLLSRAGEDGAPTGLLEQRPTYANIVAAFKQLAVEANPGDRVYIHYSGHGARGPTEYPGIKGPAGQDEALVPCDIGEPGSRYLRDLELAALIRLLVDRGLVITVVLDCCHSGGASGIGPALQGNLSARRDPPGSEEAERYILNWSDFELDRRQSPGLKLQSWLPVASYALFAACRPDEVAFEYPFEQDTPRGALSYWLLDTLVRYGIELSCGEIHQRLLACIRGSFASQTPMFLGDSQRGFLSAERHPVMRTNLPGGLLVLRVDEDSQVLINVGLATGAKVEDRVLLKGLSPQGVSAELVIRRVGATESWAEVISVLGSETIEPGMRAEFLGGRTVVRLIQPEIKGEAERALARLREALGVHGDRFIEVCENGTAPDLCVTVDTNGTYEVLDPGGTPFSHLSPLPVGAPGVVRKLIQRLDHLAKFRNILTAENPEPPDWLEIGLEVLEGDRSAAPVPLSSRVLDLRVGESLTLRIVNRSSRRLDFAALDLAPDYSVTQLLPRKGTLSLLPLDPMQAAVVPLRGWLPPGYDEGNEVLKVFATKGAANFRWLELGPLDRPGLGLNLKLRGGPEFPIEGAHLPVAGLVARGRLVLSEFPEEEWITAQVEIRVRR